MAHRFTIGVEEEFQIIDPATCELRSHVSQLVSAASPDIAEQVKHELHQSIVETGTRICENVSELRIKCTARAGNSSPPPNAPGSRWRPQARIHFQAGSIRSSLRASATSTSSKRWGNWRGRC